MPELLPYAPGSPEWLAAWRTGVTGHETAEVDGVLFGSWSAAKDSLRTAEEQVRTLEALLRDQAGDASVLTVNGRPVARRIISTHTSTWTSDHYRRISRKGDDDG